VSTLGRSPGVEEWRIHDIGYETTLLLMTWGESYHYKQR
jgi:hypothetical protein